MATADSVKVKLQGLLDKANDTTGGADADLTNAVKRLCDGYGSGESGSGNDQLPAVCEGTVTSLDLPTVTRIKDYMFQQCGQLTNIRMPKVETIGNNAFYWCPKLAIRDIPKKCRSIGSQAFFCCTGLREITFHGLTLIEPSAFGGCGGITTITVPWAEGDVPNAPWGAYNATINYNCNVEGADSQAPIQYKYFGPDAEEYGDGRIYFNAGWTWRDYIDSDFNVYGLWWDESEELVYWDSYVPVYDSNDNQVNANDLIESELNYFVY